MGISKAAVVRITNLLAFLLVILFNALGFFLPLGSSLVGEEIQYSMNMSGLSYIIWALIYGLMALFIVYQLLPFTYEYDYINRGISPFFISHCLSNAAWVLAQAYSPNNALWIQLIFIYTMLFSLALTYLSVNRYIWRDLNMSLESDDHYYINFLFGRAWISVYLAWIVTLSCVNSFALLTNLDFTSFQNASITFAAVGLLAIILMIVNRDLLFGLTIFWSSIWFSLANYRGKEGTDYDIQFPVFISAVTVASCVILVCLITLARNVAFLRARISNRRMKSSESAPPMESV